MPARAFDYPSPMPEKGRPKTNPGADVGQAPTLHSATRFTTDPTQLAPLAHAHTEVAGVSQTVVVHVAPTQLEDARFETRYELGETLGQGGMGEVRACRDRQIGREVALKIVHRRLG